ncbi:1-acyl-sn-glycerol-3-phosphate acyltransferase [Porphyromonadaceae bacterium OttesenSCG-928-L07]|nr:1-acyl-sn-glycerol-3-phosphate acyltransferase [Porphyromonadaceae bacterium OttesenSCG-928-L07]MDL2252281.1 1-acyl-sn-glycerol-3-phosphate acyltransferase [Odoribacter sp. OttesenSCG-928-J03]MDL2330775.1 1-acyl-sn-glycerol-3-phosphate acyltransferase [Odoribacter sp. OttesenSCG-928-A06]
MTLDPKFDHIRPYIDGEIDNAISRLRQNKEFLSLMSNLTKIDEKDMIDDLKDIRHRDEFQQFFGKIITAIIQHTSDGLSVSGLENLKPDTSYLFMSNHRDIILDSAILNLILQKNGLKYTQAAIGSNLLVNQWVTDFVKLESCFVIERDIPVKEMITSSSLRSEYIRDLLSEENYSVWIAQKEGRTKNGKDKTQPSLLKMLNMSGKDEFAKNFKELKVVPVAISYEWEPCDYLKTKEQYTKTVSEYVKTPEDDMNSMVQGLAGYKGRIHFTIEKPLCEELEPISGLSSNGDKSDALAKMIDDVIYRNFKLWPNNYIAYDLLHSVNKFSSEYTEEEKEKFIQSMYQKIDKIDGNKSSLNNFFLEIYANPVTSKLNNQ